MTALGGFSNLETVVEALQTREMSSTELVDIVLGRIEKWNPLIGALTGILKKRARYEADVIDSRRAAGERLPDIAGIPIVVKDIIDTTPAICSAGLPFLTDYHPTKDAVVVRQLRQAGAIIVGVSATDPGAFGVRTAQVTHPQTPDRSVGGSSGGSSAALAAGFCFAALGTDTGGSIRIPAACCLTTGLMPTLGRVSTAGVRPLVWSLDHVGPITRDVPSIRLVQQILDPGFESTTRKGLPGKPIIGHDPDYYCDADPEVKSSLERTLAVCQKIGAEIREVSLPNPNEAIDTHTVIFCSESAAYHFETFPGRIEEYPPVPRQLLEMSKIQTGYQYVLAMQRRAAISNKVQLLFKDVDFLVLPTLPVLAPLREVATVNIGGIEFDFTMALIRYTFLFDHTGNPVVSLPVNILSPGVGVSMQIIGPLNRDADTVAFAEQLESHLDLKIDYKIRVKQS